MLQFAGVDFSSSAVHVAFLGRDLSLTLEGSAPILGTAQDSGNESPGESIPPAEWTRAADYALREAYLALPADARQVAAIGFSGPSGWIGIDRELAPMGDVRLCASEAVAGEIETWLAGEARRARQLEIILSPKDWYRFVVSRGFADDATSVGRAGLLLPEGGDWNRERLDAHSIDRRWLPPVFAPTVRTGRLGERGASATGIPDAPWLAAGCLRSSAMLVAAGDLRTGALWCPDGASHAIYTLAERPATIPEGYRAVPAPWDGHWTLERALAPGAASSAEISRIEEDLRAAGFEVSTVSRESGRAAVGVALCAAIASGLLKDWDRIYRIYRPPV